MVVLATPMRSLVVPIIRIDAGDHRGFDPRERAHRRRPRRSALFPNNAELGVASVSTRAGPVSTGMSWRPSNAWTPRAIAKLVIRPPMR